MILQATNVPSYNVSAQLLAAMLRKIGVNAELAPSDWGDIVTRRAKKDPVEKAVGASSSRTGRTTRSALRCGTCRRPEHAIAAYIRMISTLALRGSSQGGARRRRHARTAETKRTAANSVCTLGVLGLWSSRLRVALHKSGPPLGGGADGRSSGAGSDDDEEFVFAAGSWLGGDVCGRSARMGGSEAPVCRRRQRRDLEAARLTANIQRG
ncbi:hypothetical protein BQ8482_300041 [Mesorhizobium delmotii]|uniref:Uncharacterized protein n=1 Tax=Mesorhizobium delmotii TaxID=1631247 RepID=A0A2P9AND9_9HYPH|nr:hypothetical protein BQ8482_300041 [Mesorhizobium delmotii]